MADETLVIRIVGDGDGGKREVAEVRREVRGLSRDVRVASVDVDRGGTRMAGGFGRARRGSEGLNNSLLRTKLVLGALAFGPAVSGANALAASMVALTGAVGPALGGLTAIPSVLGAVVQGMGAVKLATHGVGDAVGAMVETKRAATLGSKEHAAALDREREALSKLTPEARAFARELASMSGDLDGLRRSAGRGFFPGAERGLREARQLLPLARRLSRQSGRSVGDTAGRAGRMLGSERWQRDLETLGSRNVETLDRMGASALHLADALRHVMVEADPLLDWLTRSTAGWARHKEQQALVARQTGELAGFFDRSRFAIERLVSISDHVGDSLSNIFRAGNEDGQHFLTSLDRITGRFEDWTGSLEGQNALKRWFAGGRETMGDVADAIGDLRDRFTELRDEGRSVEDALIIVFTEGLVNAIAAGAETVAEHAPVVAEAFVRGFLNANVWGKLALGAFIAAKLSGGGLGRGFAAKLGGGGGVLGNKPVPVWVVNQTGGGGGPAGGGKGGGSKLPPVAALGPLALAAAPFVAVDQIADSPAARERATLFRKHSDQLARSRREHTDWARHVRDRTRAVTDAYERTGSIQTRVLSKSSRDLADLRRDTARETERIKTRFGQDTKAGRDALAKNYREAADAAKAQMARSGRVTSEGLQFIRRMMLAELKVYGLSGSQALNILKGDGKGGTYGDPDHNLGREGGHNRAGGGFIGRPGEAGRDTVPVMVGRGEAVLNRHQQQVVNGALGAVGIGGLGELFSKVDRPHYMARGGIVESLHPFNDPEGHGGSNSHLHLGFQTPKQAVAMGHKLQRLGWLVSQHPAFGGFFQRSYNSLHHSGRAIDANWPDAGQEAAKIRALLPLLGDLSAGAVAKLKRAKVGGADSPLRSILQGGLDGVRRAAQQRLDSVTSVSASMASSSGFSGPWTAVMAQIARSQGWSLGDWRELVRRESGGDPTAVNPSSGAFGLGQFLGATRAAYAKYGASSTDPVRQIEAMARYIADRYGNPSAALSFHDANNWYATGGVVGAAKGRKGKVRPGGRPGGKDRLRAAPAGPGSPTGAAADAALEGFIAHFSEQYDVREALAQTLTPLDLSDDFKVYQDAAATWGRWFDIARMNNAPQSIIRTGGLLQSARDNMVRVLEAAATAVPAPDSSQRDAERASLLATLLGQSQQAFRVSQAQFQTLKGFPSSVMPFVGSFKTGGVVPETGLAYVHKGETVTPEGAAPTVNVYVDGDLAPLIRRVRTEIDTRSGPAAEKHMVRQARAQPGRVGSPRLRGR